MPYYAGTEEPLPANQGAIDGARTFTSRQAYGAAMGDPATKKRGWMKAAGLHDPGGRKSMQRHRRSGQGKGRRRKGG